MRIAKVKTYDKFDSLFFGYTKKDTSWIDPKERLVLEAAYEALFDAGITPESLRGSTTGVYHGSCFQEPHTAILEPLSMVKSFPVCTSRLSSHLNLKGPVFHIDTACASSFCAFHEAVMAVKSGYCDMVIATGSNTCFQPFISSQMSDLNMISDDGKSKSLDVSADGYARSEAVVVVIVQKRKDAKRIYGTILNSTSNSDGYKVEGITFPGTKSQVACVRQTYEAIGLDPNDINYIEAHATGTAAGDPIELNSMHEVLVEGVKRKEPVLVGCIKTNLGHAEGASGLVSLAKAIVVFQNNLIPPNLHYVTPNEKIKGLVDGSFIPVTKTTPLPGDLITLNSFGFGGSNIHTVFKREKREKNPAVDIHFVGKDIPRLINICGRTEAAVRHVYNYIQHNPKTHTRDFFYLMDQMSQVSYDTGMAFRGFMTMVFDSQTCSYKFNEVTPVKVLQTKPIHLHFSGSSDESLLRSLLSIPSFSQSLEKSSNILNVLSIYDEIPIKGIVDENNNEEKSIDFRILQETSIQLALVDLMKKLSIQVSTVSGTSIGELSAAYFLGCLSLHQALVISYAKATSGQNPKRLVDILSKVFPKELKKPQEWISVDEKTFSADLLFKKLTAEKNGTKIDAPKNAIVITCGSQGFRIDGSNVSTDVSTDRSINGSTDGSIDEMLNILGNLYLAGHKPKVEVLYPKVALPLPSTTPSINPLIRWDHRETFKLIDTHLLDTTTHGMYTMMCKNIPFHFDSRLPEDSFLLDHRIDGRNLFPATGYLMLAYSTFLKLLNKKLDDVPVEFNDVSFREMVMVSKNKELDFLVRMNEETGHFEIKEGETVVVTGKIRKLPNETEWMHPDLDNFEPDRDPEKMILRTRDIYKEYRVRGYDYQPYFMGILNALSDGVEGTIIWRDVMPSSVRDNFNLRKQEDIDAHWLRSWLVFVDNVCQLNLLSNKKSGRGLYIPTGLKSLICYPKTLKQSIAEHSGQPDGLVMGESSHLRCFTNVKTDTLYTTGLIIKGLKTNLMRRNYDSPKTNNYIFVPFDQQTALEDIQLKEVTRYYNECLRLMVHILSGNLISPAVENQLDYDLTDEKHSLLKFLVKKAMAEDECKKISLDKDMLIGKYEDHFYFPDTFMKPVYDLVTRSFYENRDKQLIEVTEVSFNHFNLGKVIRDLTDKAVYYDKLVTSYNLITTSPSLPPVEPEMTAGMKSVLNYHTLKSIPASELIILKMFDGQEIINSELMNRLFGATKEGGFLMAFVKEEIQSNLFRETINGQLFKKDLKRLTSENVSKLAESCGYVRILTKKLYGKILPLNVLLFRKNTIRLKPDEQIILEVSTEDMSWMQELKDAMVNANDDQRIWLMPKVDDVHTQNKVTGLVGFVKSLRLEPESKKVRCLIDYRLTSKPDFRSEKYSHLLAKDLIINYFDCERNEWGDFEQFLMKSFAGRPVSSMKEVYLKPMKPGDLNSLVWAESDVNKDNPLYHGKNLVRVNYAPLNFKDVLYAAGKLPIDSVSGISPVVAQDSLLGTEFSGIDSNGRRVMGSLPYKSIASCVALQQDSFVFPVPDKWTLEDAATVPVVYLTAIYALQICGKLLPKETVLIHAGAGGVGLAAIQIALSNKCTVFTTVGSKEKRDFLLKQFPSLNPNHIMNSRSTKFEEEILLRTDGRGVNVILNSLAGDKMQSSLNCLADHGRFLEIGKVDFLNDTKLQGIHYDGNKTIIGILLDSFFSTKSEKFKYPRLEKERKELYRLMTEGIASGIVKPLKRTVFGMDEVENAFRFMSTGKHVGKVVIRIDQEETSVSQLNTRLLTPDLTTKMTYFDCRKSYIIIGGLGGFGLEVAQWMAERGARNLVLSARRGVREPYQRYCIDRLRSEYGVKVTVSQVNVASEEGVVTLINEGAKLAPVGGYFNIAAFYSDSLFAQQTEEMFQSALTPKANATFLFDKLSRVLCPEMDYFVCFSSLSAGRGNPGQGYYNYGNSFMEAVCERRRRDGLHGLAIQWGVIGDVGEVSERSGGNGTVLLGCTSQRMPSCLEYLDKFLQTSETVVGSCVLANEFNSDGQDSTDVLKLLSRILGMKNIQSIDPSSTMASLGIDSLMAVELQQIIERNVGVKMSWKTIRELSVRDFVDVASGLETDSKT